MSERHDEVTYSDDQVPGRLILRLLALLVGISVTLCLFAYVLLVVRESQLRPRREFPEKELGAPHEIANVRAAPFEILRPEPPLVDRQRAKVDSFGWVDKQHGLVRIPVGEAAEEMLRSAK